MTSTYAGPLTLTMELEHWPRTTPVRITGYTWDTIDVLLVSVEKDGHVGRGEASGVYYRSRAAWQIAGLPEPRPIRCSRALWG